MPTLLEIPVLGKGMPPRNVYRALHANVLRWLSAAAPEFGAAVHDRPIRKPFAISGLWGERGYWWWRVALLDDTLWEPFWAGALLTSDLNVDGRSYQVRWADAHVIRLEYELIALEAETATHIPMAFVSPTTFRAGDLDMPLPVPHSVFRSWLSRWNDFAAPASGFSESLLDVIHEHVAISGISSLQTVTHDLGRSSPVGFVGEVTFVITRSESLNEGVVKRLNALAQYAEFCGTGRKTTQGMGQTRRIRRG